MIQKIDEIQVIFMLEETLKYDWVQHLKILTPPDDKSWIYVRADGLQPKQIDELLDIGIAYIQTYNHAMFCRGLWIYVDGRNWLGSYAACDSYFEEWFFGLAKIFDLGENSETPSFQEEECSVVMKRVSDQLTLSASYGYPITLNLWDFTRHLIEAGEVYLQLVEKLWFAIETYDKSKNVQAELTCILEVLAKVEVGCVRACLDKFRSELAKVE